MILCRSRVHREPTRRPILSTCLDTWLALILLVAAGSKARRPEAAATALATYGLTGARLRHVALWLLIVLEFGLGVALLSELGWAPPATAGLLALFSVTTLAAMLGGRVGRPCACFGSRARLSWWTPLGSAGLALAAAAVAVGWLPAAQSDERWLAIGLAVCVAAVAAFGLVVLALAREVGMLRLSLASHGALEIVGEGPELGAMPAWAGVLPWQGSSLLGLAIFTSEGCPLCHQLAPTLAYVAADPLLAVRVFDEVADAAIWRQAGVPGSPYAVAVDSDGLVRAKGTFNSLPQLESIIATARTRSQEVALVI